MKHAGVLYVLVRIITGEPYYIGLAVPKKPCIFIYFDSQHLVLFTMVPRSSVCRARSRLGFHVCRLTCFVWLCLARPSVAGLLFFVPGTCTTR